jgi:glutamate-1-semialdehyde 2,1-aminomutase/spore coat polysaccharide biosynthesis protein SpsF
LILDEVVTGLRYGLGGAAELYGIQPDIICMGKALGNGVPISCMVGHREYFDWFSRNDPVFVSSTHFGNPLGLAAADAVLNIWGEEQVDQIWEIGKKLMFALEAAGLRVKGDPPRSLLQFDNPYDRAYFIVGMRDRGILMNRPNIPNLAHTEADVEMTEKAALEITTEMKRIDTEELMRDRLPRVLFEGR